MSFFKKSKRHPDAGPPGFGRGDITFRTPEQVEQFVSAELSDLPEGWRLCPPLAGRRLDWRIEKTKVRPGEWPNQDFWIRVSFDLQFFIITCGNNDMGCGGIHQDLQTARVIEAVSVKRLGLGKCVQYVIGACKPNEWGYT